MNTRINHIRNWPELAQRANWSVSELAKLCDVSVRTLQRYFIEKMGKSPRAWLSENRHQRAIALLYEGRSVKETAVTVGYQHPTDFSRAFRNQCGYSPLGQVATQLLINSKPNPTVAYCSEMARFAS